jgi:hypothetical protein
MKMRNYYIALSAMVLACAPAMAGTQVTYALNMTGLNVTGGGDADGTASGTIQFDPDAGQITWSLNYSNLDDDITGWGFGLGDAGEGGGLGFMGNDSFPAGDGTYNGTANISAGNQNFLLGEGDGAFFVIRTSGFASGAVRDQLGTEIPAPGAACVLGLAGIAATRRRH